MKEDKLDPNLDSRYLRQKHLLIPKGLTTCQKVHRCAALQHIDRRTPTATLTHCNTPNGRILQSNVYRTIERQFLTPGIFTSPEIRQQRLFLDFLEERFAELLTRTLNDKIAHQTLEGLTIEDIEDVCHDPLIFPSSRHPLTSFSQPHRLIHVLPKVHDPFATLHTSDAH